MPDNLPTFLIVGAAKSGTTSLYHYLKEHPEIFMSEVKEPRFFAFADTELPHNIWEENSINHFEDYKLLFKNADEHQKRGEASVHYLFLYEQTIQNIRKYLPAWKELKIVIILRNPLERAFSNYSMLKLKGAEQYSFKEAIKLGAKRKNDGEGIFYDYIGAGMYHNQVKAYYETFPHVRIYLFEDLVKDPHTLLKDLYDYVDVDHNFVPTSLNRKFNPSGAPKNKKIQNFLSNIQNFLINYHWQSVLKPVVRIVVPQADKRQKLFDLLLFSIANLKNKNLERITIDTEMKTFLLDMYREEVLKLQNLIKKDISQWLR
jgi:hypothetical protein